MFKHILKISICVILIALIAYIAYWLISFKNVYNPTPIQKEKIVNEFSDNKEKFNNVSRYLIELGTGANIDLEDSGYVIIVVEDGKLKNVTVEDKKVDADIKFILFKLKYMRILSGEKDIDYVRQSSSNWSRGVIYSKDSSKPYISENSILEEMDKNWYFSIDVAK